MATLETFLTQSGLNPPEVPILKVNLNLMKIVILSSSVRDGRNTHQVARSINEVLNSQSGVESELIDLLEYDLQNIRHLYKAHPNPPDTMKEIYEKFMDSDGYIFVSPEYNGSYSGALKNAVDHFPKSAYIKKPIGVATVSTGAMGGMRAALQMQLLVLALKGIPSPEMLLTPVVEDKFEEGKLTDEDFEKRINYFIKEYLWLARNIIGN